MNLRYLFSRGSKTLKVGKIKTLETLSGYLKNNLGTVASVLIETRNGAFVTNRSEPEVKLEPMSNSNFIFFISHTWHLLQ